jgi:RNA recognition motif-containing protein
VARKLYVGNLPFNVTEEQVRELFSQIGEVDSVKIITDRETGRSRGFCFVEMDNADEAASSLNGKDFGGRNITVNEAHEKVNRQSFGGNQFKKRFDSR